MRVVGVLNGRAYLDLATALDRAGYPAEVRSVLEEGLARHLIRSRAPEARNLLAGIEARLVADRAGLATAQRAAFAASTGVAALRTADAMLGNQRPSEAIALYNAARNKSGVDQNVVLTRLGIALAASGDRTRAAAAFRSTTGPRADLAKFWLAWLQQPAR